MGKSCLGHYCVTQSTCDSCQEKTVCQMIGIVVNKKAGSSEDRNKFDFEVEDLKKQLRNGIIPQTISKEILNNYEYAEMRYEFIKYQGFAIITMDWTKDLAEFIGDSKCLEVMAGSGALTKALKNHGVDIRATDNFSWGDKSDNLWHENGGRYCEVEKLSAVEAIEKYNDVDYILMSWPPYDEPHGYDALMAMRKYNPNARLIYIGEGYGGCTADDAFHEAVEEVDNHRFNVDIPHWRSIWDRVELYK